jgi:TrmH family RNA methyltransferase
LLDRLARIVIVLCETTEPGNIGAVCRAMKTMGLARLRLVRPHDPHGERARALAHGAQDILAAAEIHPDLTSALRDVSVAAGTTSRVRQLRKHALLSPAELADRLIAHAETEKVAILFGTERTGLTNEEINLCRYTSVVQTAAPQPSLNLAQAVMLYCYELRRAARGMTVLGASARGMSALQSIQPGGTGRRRTGGASSPLAPEMRVAHPHRSTRMPTQLELDLMYAHLGRAMASLGYTEAEQRKFLTYLRQLHMRAGIVDWELQIYHLLAQRILRATGTEPFAGGE